MMAVVGVGDQLAGRVRLSPVLEPHDSGDETLDQPIPRRQANFLGNN